MKCAAAVCLLALVTAAADAAPALEPTGRPPGAKALESHNSKGFPAPALTPGQPIETRAPELATDKPAFPGQTRAPYKPTAPYRVAVVTDRLDLPWSLAFLPDGKMLVTEKRGAMRVVTADGALSAPIAGLPSIYYRGQVGLLDVTLDPHFAVNHRLFFSFAQPIGSDEMAISIARAALDESALSLSDVKIIFTARPALPRALSSNAGGRLALAADGTLFAVIGDRSKSPPWTVAQQMDTDLGKIIHIMSDGEPAPGNPYAGKPGALPEIWTLGHRSEIGLAFDPDGRLWETENGPRGGDELNLIQAGKNYGWPLITHGIDYPGELIDDGATEKSGLEQPRYYWDPVIAPAGLAFYRGDLFPAWRNSAFVGALRGKMLDRLTVSGDKVVDEEPLLTDVDARIRDVRIGPDGAVYVLTDDTRLLKLTPK